MQNKMILGLIAGTLFSSAALAEPVMTKAEYADYSVAYRCIEQRFHDNLDKKEEALVALDEKFGLNDDNFDDFDDLITEYERDALLLDSINQRAQTEC